jgi:hypothetical protein
VQCLRWNWVPVVACRCSVRSDRAVGRGVAARASVLVLPGSPAKRSPPPSVCWASRLLCGSLFFFYSFSLAGTLPVFFFFLGCLLWVCPFFGVPARCGAQGPLWVRCDGWFSLCGSEGWLARLSRRGRRYLRASRPLGWGLVVLCRGLARFWIWPCGSWRSLWLVFLLLLWVGPCSGYLWWIWVGSRSWGRVACVPGTAWWSWREVPR